MTSPDRTTPHGAALHRQGARAAAEAAPPILSWPGPPPLAVVLDLDDTLYPQAAFLHRAARAVGRAAAEAGLDGAEVTRALDAELAAGSERGRTVDRALAACGVDEDTAAALVPALVEAFRGYRPESLPLYPGAADALAALRAAYPVACLTDGDPRIQRAKLAATGIAEAVDAVVITDELGGRELRKPHPAGLLRAAELLGVPVTGVVMVGDRPGKDVAVARALGARSVRVCTGEYADQPDEPAADLVVPDVVAAAALLCTAAARRAPGAVRSPAEGAPSLPPAQTSR